MGLLWGFITPNHRRLTSAVIDVAFGLYGPGAAVMSKPRGQKLLAVPYGYGDKLPATSPSGGLSFNQD